MDCAVYNGNTKDIFSEVSERKSVDSKCGEKSIQKRAGLSQVGSPRVMNQL